MDALFWIEPKVINNYHLFVSLVKDLLRPYATNDSKERVTVGMR